MRISKEIKVLNAILNNIVVDEIYFGVA